MFLTQAKELKLPLRLLVAVQEVVGSQGRVVTAEEEHSRMSPRCYLWSLMCAPNAGGCTFIASSGCILYRIGREGSQVSEVGKGPSDERECSAWRESELDLSP
jgi:hypothetical protein